MKWMNNSIFESIFAVFDYKPPFLSILDTYWPIFGHFSYSTSINHSLTIDLNNILNWITRVYFELNNILNWILGKAILNRILNDSFFGKIQILKWIRLGIVNHYLLWNSIARKNRWGWLNCGFGGQIITCTQTHEFTCCEWRAWCFTCICKCFIWISQYHQ